MIKSVIFDLDGTLIFAEKAIIKGIQKCFQFQGLYPPKEEIIRQTIGLSLTESFTMLGFPDPEAGATLYREYFLEQPEDITINPESADLLVTLVQKHIRIGIVTNRRLGKVLVDKLSFPVRFDIVVDLSQGIQPKPSPEGILFAVKHFKVDPIEVLLVGDTHFDIQAGKSAGVKVAGYSKGMHVKTLLNDYSPDWIIDSLSDILSFL